MGYFSSTNDLIDSIAGTSQQENQLGVDKIGTTNYTRDPSGTLLDQRPSSGVDYTLTDHLGSTIGVEHGAAVSRTYTYDDDGNDASTGTGNTIPFRYDGGQKTDNLTHFGQRYYDSTSAQWTQPDPLNEYTDLTNANHYVYAGADSVGEVDPSGTEPYGSDENCGATSCSDANNYRPDNSGDTEVIDSNENDDGGSIEGSEKTAGTLGGCITGGFEGAEYGSAVGSPEVGAAVGCLVGGGAAHKGVNAVEPAETGQP